MKIQMNRSEKGQALIILVLLFVGFIGLLALVLDGGSAYTIRRQAQNAADAGALAGADTMCRNDALTRTAAETLAQTVALDYAVNHNGAFSAAAAANQPSRTITVDTTARTNALFAGIIGVDQINANATARAGCFPVCSASTVMPFAWACSPSVAGSQSPTCAMEFGTPDSPGPIYIIMDTESVNKDFFCQNPPNSGLPANSLDCDFDDDNINDALAGGNRSWLDINGGGGGSSEMSTWITSGNSPLLQVQSWVPGTTGVRDTIFGDVQLRVGDIVTIPVFDKYCDGVPNATCAQEDLGDVIVDAGGASALYFHVVALAGFKITCVADEPNDTDCAGHNQLDSLNPSLPKSLKTIEGYFVKGYVPNMSKCTDNNPFYTGVFTVHLLP